MQNKERKQVETLTKIYTAIVFVIIGVLIGRLAWLQLVEKDFYASRADAQRNRLMTIPATRGDIISSDGVVLEQNADILQALLPQTEILRFPAWDTVPYDRVSPNVNIIARRTDTLGKLAFAPEAKRPRIIAASVGAILQKLPPKRIFLNSMKEIKVGESLNFNDFLHYASVNGYSRVEQVMEPGEYAVRGDILDIFPTGTTEPLRIDLFGDEVEKIRFFDAENQLSKEDASSAEISPATEFFATKERAKWFWTTIRSKLSAAVTGRLSAPLLRTTKFTKRCPTGASIWEWKTGCRFSMRSRYRPCLTICRGQRSSSGATPTRRLPPKAKALPTIMFPVWKRSKSKIRARRTPIVRWRRN